ncbi:MAG TPA: S8 family serine peptidase [Pseudomonadales bacterium]|nr:S8 family serine peptidase [Pseudomonadales bacterium]
MPLTAPRHPAAALIRIALLILPLAGCGGGGSGSDPSAAPAPATNLRPIARFTATPAVGEAPLRVTLDASASTDGDGTIVAYDWAFGDGATASGVTVEHVYEAVGTYAPRLTIRDDDGASASRVDSVTVELPLFTLGGTILIQAASAIDSDTNDPDSAVVSNNSFDAAQIVPNPATIGGYVASGPGVGPPGAVSTTGDPMDTYAFSAVGGEIITLNIGDAGQDLDLYLLDATGTIRDSSLAGSGNVSEQVGPVPSAGDWRVRVVAVDASGDGQPAAFGTYVLTIGQAQSTTGSADAVRAGRTAPTDLRLASEFVPGEVLLGPRRTAAAIAAGSGNGSGNGGVTTLVEAAADHPAAGVRLARLRRGDRDMARRTFADRPQPDAVDARLATLLAVKDLRARGDHEWVSPNWIRRAQKVPNDQYFPNQWHYPAIKLPQAWDVTTGAATVTVAVIDTGVLLDHPEFRDPVTPSITQLVPGYDFISSPVNAADGDGPDADPTDEGDADLGSSSSFHGSHVAGTIAARTDNGNGDGTGGGVAGVAWGVRLMPLRVLGRDGGTSADLIQALRFAAGLSNSSGIILAADERPDIVNLSLGGAGPNPAEQEAIDALRAAGIIVVAAAGNDSSSQPFYPAAYDNVVSVSATTINSRLARYSNFGSTIDVAAPGGDVATDVNGDGIPDGVLSVVGDDSDGDPTTPPVPKLDAYMGTSMAAPHVAGVAALMKSVHPGLTPLAFDQLLAGGSLTDDLGASGRDDLFGQGLINAQRAVAAAQALAGGAATIGPILVANPSRLNFGAFSEVLEFRLSNAGDGALDVLTAVPSEPWLTLQAPADANGLGIWTARANRALLPSEGVFAASITVTSDANAVTIPVQVELAGTDLSADAGTTTVALFAPGADSTELFTVLGQASNGVYEWSFAVPAGEYEIIASSNSDADDFLCDGGESCGVYRTPDSPTVVVVTDAAIGGLDFVTGFRVGILGQTAAPTAQGAASSGDGARVDGQPALPAPAAVPRVRRRLP